MSAALVGGRAAGFQPKPVPPGLRQVLPLTLIAGAVVVLLLAGPLAAVGTPFHAAETQVAPAVSGVAASGGGRGTSGVEPSDPTGLSAGWHAATGLSPSPVLTYRLFTVPLPSAACPAYVGIPAGMAYDSADGSVWVASPSSCVDRVMPDPSGFGWNLTAAVQVGTNPFGVAYDNATDEIFVSNTGSDNVTVISGSTNLSVASIGVGSQPSGVAYDPSTREVYVANGGSNNVSVITDTNLTVVRSIPVGSDPVGVVADPASHQVFVANHGSNNVSILSTSTHTVAAVVATGNGSYGVAVDNLTDMVYVTNNASQNVSVINASTDTLVATIPVVFPGIINLEGITFDSALDQLWIGGGWSAAVVIDPTQQAVLGYAGLDPSGVLYDPANGDICLANTGNATFECLSISRLDYMSDTAPLTFHETGLGAAPSWAVTVNASYWTTTTTQWSAGQNVTFGVVPTGGIWSGSPYWYAVEAPFGYVATPSRGSVTVSGATTVNVTITPENGTYTVAFTESGLPTGTYWVAELTGPGLDVFNHTTSATNTFRMPNGSYGYAIGQTGMYVPSPSNGTVNVSGTAVRIGIVFTAPPTYAVHFHESGLASGALWEVWLGGATQSSNTSNLELNVTNGTYVFVITATQYVCPQSPGNLTVAGAPVWVNVTFTPAPYSVTFYETGLPAATSWTVALDGLSRAGVTTVTFYEPNGTFPFTVASVPGYDSNPSSGNVTVAGLDLNVTIQFLPASNDTFEIVFTETGLPAGTLWSVTLSGVTNSSVTSSLSFDKPRGVYSVSVGAVPGYNSTVQDTVTVTNASLAIGVVFAPLLYTLTFEETGLPNGTGWGVVIGNEVESTIGDNVTFRRPTGTYDYVLLAVPGYLTQYSGTATVNAANTTVAVTFTPQTYPIVFIEFGLPAGSNWSVTVSNTSLGFNETKSSTTNSIIFFLPNGTYSVSFTLPPGFTGTSSSNLVIVAGRSVSGPTISAQAQGAAWPPWLPAWWLLSVVVAAAVIAGALGTWVLLRRHPPSGPARPESSQVGGPSGPP